MNGKCFKMVTCFALTLVVLAGCTSTPDKAADKSGKDTASSTAGNTASADPNALSWKKDTSPFTFTQFFYGNWASNYLWKDQYDMKLITDKTGVKIDRKLATGSDDDYLNTMIASGDLPDSIMLDWNNPAVTKLINNGMVYSMNELIDKYAPEMWKMLDPDMVKYHSINDKLWYLPNLYETKDRLTSGKPIVGVRPWFIRKDILDAIGNPKIETPDDLLNALKKAKEKFPNVSPVGVEVFDVAKFGFQGSLSMDYLIYSFSPKLNEERIKDDKQIVEYPMRNKGFIDAFRFLNTLNRNGLFDPQLLIYKQEQYEEKLYGGQYAVASQFMDGIYTKFNPKIDSTLGKDKEYTVLDGLKVNGQDPRYPASRLMGWQGFFISKKAKDPGRILRFVEYAWSDEGQMDFRYGKEGETYDMVDGLPEYKPEVKALQLKDNNAWYAKYGFTASTLLWKAGKIWDDADTKDFMKTQPDQYAALKLLSKYGFDLYSLGMENSIQPEGSSAEGVINVKVKDLWNKTIPKLVLAKSDSEFDSIYADFINQMNKVGAEKAEKVMYQRHLLDLNKKGIK
jgi:putative aldouronate transport system substrate-binding protein